ncbi:MAG TPA: type II toxin-antitoxin system VapC family toxin [Bryobacteraceae bacterium]|jgi:ribonuclease VapC
MTVDSSAIIAILCQEPGCERLLDAIGKTRVAVIGAPTVAETQLALTVRLGQDASSMVEQFLVEAKIMIVPFGRDHISAFFEAFLRFGKRRHPAALNMGDCFTYAIAKVAKMPVLFTGNDFSQTDIGAA